MNALLLSIVCVIAALALHHVRNLESNLRLASTAGADERQHAQFGCNMCIVRLTSNEKGQHRDVCRLMAASLRSTATTPTLRMAACRHAFPVCIRCLMSTL